MPGRIVRWIMFGCFALFVLFLYGPTLTIMILSFQGPDGGLTFPMNGVSLHWFANLFERQAVGDFGGSLMRSFALALMVMDARLKVRLRVLIPAVENAVAGNAFRPLDIFPSRKGLNVEIGNTDAEGRLVLADALALACEEKPDLLIDLGTLTGAARVALGPDLPPFYTPDDKLAQDVARCAKEENDPLW